MNESTDSVLSDGECEIVLNNYLSSSDYKLHSFDITSLSDSVEGFIGQHFTLKIAYTFNGKECENNFFVKVLGTLKVVEEISTTTKAFEKEAFFYNELLKELENENIDISFAPSAYFCKNKKVVLEDVRTRGFKTTPPNEPFDLEHLHVVLESLAKLHTASIIYETKKRYKLTEIHGDILADKVFTKEENAATKWFQRSIEGFKQIIDHLNLTDTEKQTFKTNLVKLFEEETEIVKVRENEFATVIHGDVWSNNFLFNYNNTNKPISCIIVDYQMMKYGSPILDVVQMLYSNTRKSYRDEHSNELIKYYVECCNKLLERVDVSMDLDQVFTIYERVKSVVKLAVTIDRSVTMVSSECMADVQSDEAFYKFFYDDRSARMMDSFTRNEFYREVLQEDLLELMNLLLIKYNK